MTRADDLALIERIGEYVRGCALSVGDDDLRRLCALARAGLTDVSRAAEPTAHQLAPDCIGFTNGCHCPSCMGAAEPPPARRWPTPQSNTKSLGDSIREANNKSAEFARVIIDSQKAPTPSAPPPQNVAGLIARLRDNFCPGNERDRVGDCLRRKDCGCTDGEAVEAIESLAAALAAMADDLADAQRLIQHSEPLRLYSEECAKREQAERDLAERNESLNAAADEIIRLKHDLAVAHDLLFRARDRMNEMIGASWQAHDRHDPTWFDAVAAIDAARKGEK